MVFYSVRWYKISSLKIETMNKIKTVKFLTELFEKNTKSETDRILLYVSRPKFDWIKSPWPSGVMIQVPDNFLDISFLYTTEIFSNGLEVVSERGHYLGQDPHDPYYDYESGVNHGEVYWDTNYFLQLQKDRYPSVMRGRIIEIEKLQIEKKALIRHLQEQCKHKRVVKTRYEGLGCNDHVNHGVCIDCWKHESAYDAPLETLNDSPSIWVSSKQFDSDFRIDIHGIIYFSDDFIKNLGYFTVS